MMIDKKILGKVGLGSFIKMYFSRDFMAVNLFCVSYAIKTP